MFYTAYLADLLKRINIMFLCSPLQHYIHGEIELLVQFYERRILVVEQEKVFCLEMRRESKNNWQTAFVVLLFFGTKSASEKVIQICRLD